MQNKQQEFLKQREKLKYVTQNNVAKKALDPDIMIEQLISDKETFKFNLESPLPYAVPKWLKVENNLVPAVYEQVWQAVKVGPTFQYCDTKIITHLFTTSGLSLEKLGYLWSLTNVSSPGILTRQELYIMLALIALIQTGYHVHDIGILNSINHPILPQLDYTFLNITVANPAINRSTRNNDVKSIHGVLFNGFIPPAATNSASLHLKQFDDPNNVKQPSKNMNTFLSTPLNIESLKNTLPLDVDCLKNSLPMNVNIQQNRLPLHVDSLKNSLLTISTPNPCKSDMDVTFAIPERNKIDVSMNFAPASELDVDFPIAPIQVEPKFNSNLKTNSSITAESRKIDFSINFKNLNSSNLLNTNSLINSLEPRSLDLPVVNELTALPDEDEFTEFQSATIRTDEYSDFQSALPVLEYELHNSSNKKIMPSFDSASIIPKMEAKEVKFVQDEPLDHKTSTEADKYDVFRALMEPTKEEKTHSPTNDYNADEDDEEDQEFSDFYAADVKQNDVKRELSIKDKCLEACLRLLQEGLRIFSSISNEQIVKEVLSDERGCRYFCQLKIVYDTSQRFQRQFESTHLNDAIQSTWAKLSKYTKYLSNEDLLDEAQSEDDVDATLCKLCETKCDVNCVRYAGHNYHVTCINLFLHFVEDSEITAMLNI